MENNEKNLNSHMIIYTTEDGLAKIETTFDEDTVWLSIDQMAELFQRDRSVIGKHVRNVFKEGELVKESETFVLLKRYSTDRFWKSMLPALTMIRKQKFPSSFLKRYKIKSIMQFMVRQRLRLFIQEQTQKKISWG